MKIIEQSVLMLNPSIQEGLDSMKNIEYAGRNCYQSQGKITEESFEPFIRSLISRGHESPLEFGQATFEIVTSRDVMAEITRHRLASFAILSQRYVLADRSGDIEFIKPHFYNNQDITSQTGAMTLHWLHAMNHAESFYKSMIENGAKPEDARTVLPNSVATKIVCSMNLRELRHFLKMRTGKGVYPPTRSIANDILEWGKIVFPVIFEDIGEESSK